MIPWIGAACMVAFICALAWLANRAQRRIVEDELVSLRGGTRRLNKAFPWPRACMRCGQRIDKRWQFRVHMGWHAGGRPLEEEPPGLPMAGWSAEVVSQPQNGTEREAVES